MGTPEAPHPSHLPLYDEVSVSKASKAYTKVWETVHIVLWPRIDENTVCKREFLRRRQWGVCCYAPRLEPSI